MERAVVTGIGAVTPIGNNVKTFWENLLAGKNGAAPITRFDASAFKTRFACEVKNFDASSCMEKTEIRKTDLFTQFAFAAVKESITDAALNLTTSDLSRIGVIWGSGMGGMATYEDGMFDFFQNNKVPRFSPLFIPKLIPNITSGQISIKYGLMGPSYSINSACASSNNAIVDAFNHIRLGNADIIIAGGSEAPINSGPIGGFNAMRALSELNESPETASRPFDATRTGFVLGEGGGALIIESLEHAVQRGANIYCELVGYGLASDGHHVTAPHPEGTGAILAMQQAIKMAGLQPKDINYINAHATATPLGDISESLAISKVFKDDLKNLHISATKSMTGHLMGAAGAVEAIATIMAIIDNKIAPTMNQFERDAAINPELNFTPNKSKDLEVNYALNNTFGFGGHIVTTLFKKFKNN